MPREPTSTGAYAEAEDDVSAMLSAVVSKVPVFGLMVGTYAAILSEADLSLAHVLGWIGMLTALAGAMLAVQQDDVKRMLAYSSMSQLGYIVTAIALMSHLGWVTALYLTANHLMTKGILFLVAAAIFCEQARAHSPTSAVSRVPCPLPLQPRRSPSWPCPVSLRSPGSAANGCC
jgi:formate hydrogenlyase subunit 3/multisubunit Na+/H+ antiporter MnhD subunit